jgi:hypothetical protein
MTGSSRASSASCMSLSLEVCLRGRACIPFKGDWHGAEGCCGRPCLQRAGSRNSLALSPEGQEEFKRLSTLAMRMYCSLAWGSLLAGP